MKPGEACWYAAALYSPATARLDIRNHCIAKGCLMQVLKVGRLCLLSTYLPAGDSLGTGLGINIRARCRYMYESTFKLSGG